RAHVQAATIDDRLDGALRMVRYANGAQSIDITVDLHANRLVERRIGGQIYQPPMLESVVAAQGMSGTLACGSASLTCEPGIAAWLVADERACCWAAANPSDTATPWQFVTPVAEVHSPAWRFGRVAVYGEPQPMLEFVVAERPAAVTIVCAQRPHIFWNGADVSAELVEHQPGTYILPAL
ncbi:MAG TPA: hypothetical protein VFT99_25040, partial [Roseiflexaceae bacterium]|nr:hypothetical protein [Roseiflexaceae bacterium]